jgi:hypothetical protein
MLRPFPSLLNVSRSFAGQMRDVRGSGFEAMAGVVVAGWPYPDHLFEGKEAVLHVRG